MVRILTKTLNLRSLSEYGLKRSGMPLFKTIQHMISYKSHTDELKSKVSLKDLFTKPYYNTSVLRNGLRVATYETSDSAITFGVWIDSGSRYESKEKNGVAHFLEHMIFKGTTKRSRYQLESEIENLGAHLNAYTSREQTVYYARCFNKDLPQCMELLGDILQNSVLDPAAIEAERFVILREMEEIEKTPEEILFDRLHMAAFKNNSLGYTILGPPENIKTINRNDLLDYIQKNYLAERMVIVGVGNLKHAEFVKHVENNFSNIPSKSKFEIPLDSSYPNFSGSEIVDMNNNYDQIVHLAVAYEGVPWDHPDMPAFMLMQSIIGSYRKNEDYLIPPKISTNKTIYNIATGSETGDIHSFSAFNTCYKDTGIFGWYAECDRKAVNYCIDHMMLAFTSLSYSITDEEVFRAKNQLKLQLFSSIETPNSIAEEIGRHLLVYNRYVHMLEWIKRIDAISVQDLKRVAFKYLYDAKIAFTTMGAIDKIPDYTTLRVKTSQLKS
ncbi:insulinase, putative [Cryptosporidium muris RN66]|uniref:Insulinase, putative n=1 Tax=Cryptosporidium muris (strain RN66) TaxID=441375 RepID=B6ACH4_CRYMR|nr:insulinase, putative [Cryptosporidium muris RN66]EEA05828.1 insulinase, putative [Cryptosporidium muris RN66]|eukprot:XP_002140177.1 insulinase [Cryptosporidium muris RN66]